MCGIAGVYNFIGDRTVDRALLEKMCSALAHRGPDDEGISCSGNIGLGHRRLSIIDIEGGHEPLSNEDGSLWLVFNGEIYNFPVIRNDLIARGHRFKTKGDAEVILHLYEEEKEKCLDKLLGMFALAIWDANRRELFVARDRLGIKPLNYSFSADRFIFASELKAILEDPSVKRDLDYTALHDYLTLMYVPAPKTIFRDIKKLPAGHYLTCRSGKVDVRCYWDVRFTDTARGSEAEIAEEVRRRLKEAVRSELISDVTLGAFLSGGVDSSSVVALMSELQDRPVITNSIGFSGKSFDELAYARLISDRYRTDHHEFVVEPNALDMLDKLVWYYDEPFDDSSAIPTYYVSQMARKTVKVALSGDGGDEDFAGYPRYRYCRGQSGVYQWMPAFMKNGARSATALIGPEPSSVLALKVKYKLGDLYLSPFDAYFKIISIFQEDETRQLYSSGLKNQLSGYRASDAFRKIFNAAGTDDFVSRLQYLDMKTSLPEEMFTKTDRAAMASGLEVRVPLMDHTFVEFVATIPSRLKAQGPTGKYIFKQAMAKDLPSEVMYRKKMGFSVPLEKWLRTDLKTVVQAELFDEKGIVAQLFDRAYIKRLWEFMMHPRVSGFDTTDLATRIWLLFIFSRWHKKFAG